MKSINDDDFSILPEDLYFSYQKDLTEKLDNSVNSFDQSILNEIVLWKVNRYAKFSESIVTKINSINVTSNSLDEELTIKILNELLAVKGVQLPMASTILRFKNPKIYQIIDQRVYRILYNTKLKIPFNKEGQIKLYLEYLNKLKSVCEKMGIDFEKSDRILYMADKRLNKDIGLDNYGKSRSEIA
jgi:thermostable 8-oxoguanine DNA glycosylase